MVEAKYKVELSQYTNSYHYDAWLEEDGRRIIRASGCSIGFKAFGYAEGSATRQAKRACRRLLKNHDKFKARDGVTVVTYKASKPQSRPLSELDARLDEVRREFGL